MTKKERIFLVIMKNLKEILQFLNDSGTIDLAYIQEQMEMKKREELLKKHKYRIWFSEKEQVWYTTLPDDTKKSGRKNIKRKDKNELLKAVANFYSITKIKEEKKERTIETLFYEYIDHKSREVCQATIKRTMTDWKRFYQPETEFIYKRIEEITKIDIDNFFNKVIDNYELKKKAFYNMCGILKQMLEYAVDAEYIDKNPYRVKINRKKLVSNKKFSEREVYTEEEKKMLIMEMERRLEQNPANTAPLAVLLDFELGVRKGEILAISTDDIDGDQIHIHKQLVGKFDTTDLRNITCVGYEIVDYTKSEDGDRWVPLTKKAKEIIERVEKINHMYGYSFRNLLFCRAGKCMHPSAIDAQIKRGCEYIGIRVKTMHKIRKTYASNLLHEGINLSAVKDLLGHSDEATTLKHYIYNTDSKDETKKAVLNVMEEKKELDNKSEQSEQKIIVFSNVKKLRNPVN